MVFTFKNIYAFFFFFELILHSVAQLRSSKTFSSFASASKELGLHVRPQMPGLMCDLFWHIDPICMRFVENIVSLFIRYGLYFWLLSSSSVPFSYSPCPPSFLSSSSSFFFISSSPFLPWFWYPASIFFMWAWKPSFCTLWKSLKTFGISLLFELAQFNNVSAQSWAFVCWEAYYCTDIPTSYWELDF